MKTNDEYLDKVRKAEARASVQGHEDHGDDLDIRIIPVITDPEKLPALPAQLISGIVYRGGKILLAGAPKSGKSWLLIELAIAVATGRDWIGFYCAKGHVLFVNLEIEEAEFMNRVYSVLDELNANKEQIGGSLDISNLRGKVSDIGALVDALLAKIPYGEYDLIIVDPAYKVQSGAENDAESITAFCAHLDRLASGLGCSIAYSHHHSKGAQGGKNAMDRASGSGVFARDADAIVDMIELEQDEAVLEVKRELGWEDAIPFRIEVALRSFKRPKPRGIWFKHPIHVADPSDALEGCKAKGTGASKEALNARSQKTLEKLENELDEFMGDEDEVNRKDFAAACGRDNRTINKYVNQSSLFELESTQTAAIIRRVKEE